MIDYDKLKIAQEPAEPGYVSEILEEIKPINGVLTLPAGDYIFKDGVTYKVKKTDKPAEPTEPKRKYKVGDQIVVYGWNEEIYEEVVTKCECIPAKEPSWTYNDWIEDNYHRIYPTKAALIAAQIKYWANLGKYCEHDVVYSACEQCNEPEYCNVSGVKLGKPEECKCNTEYFHAKDGRCVCCNKPYKEICKHESDGKVYESWDFGRFTNE